MSRVYKFEAPEGGGEHEVVLHRRHGCKNAKAFRAVMGEDIDLMQFSIGVAGAGMPRGVPFLVRSTYPCDVCGVDVQMWAEWTSKLIIP